MPARSHTPRRKAKAAKAAPAGRQRVLVARYVGLGLGMLAVAIVGMWAYANYYPSIRPRSGAQVLLVPTGSTYADLQHVLDTAQVVRDWDSFEFVAAQMNLANSVKPGRYKIASPVSCRSLITRLRGYESNADNHEVRTLAALLLKCPSKVLEVILKGINRDYQIEDIVACLNGSNA
jgi:hypothetical protein